MSELDAALNAKHARIVDAFRIMDRRGVGALDYHIHIQCSEIFILRNEMFHTETAAVSVRWIIITFSVWRDSYVYTLRNEKFHRVYR